MTAQGVEPASEGLANTSGPNAPHMVTPPGSLSRAEIEARQAALYNGFRHDNTLIPLVPGPHQEVEVCAESGGGVSLARAAVYYTVDGSLPTTAARSVPMAAAEVDWGLHSGYLTRWRASLPPQAEGILVRYRIGGWPVGGEGAGDPPLWASDGQGFWYKTPGGVTTFAYLVARDAVRLPAWTDEAVIYQIFVDRFRPDSPDGCFATSAGPQARHGGTLEGVRQALPYLAALGVTCLWLSPICTAETYHRYDTTDLYAVDPALGGEVALRALMEEVHARGMRLLLDLVPSHCSWHHPAFVAAQRDPGASTRAWFTFEHWPDRYRSFLGVAPSLPTFNTDDPGARAHIIDSAVHWLREYGVDGFRLDHVVGPSMDFWTAFRRETRAAAPDSFTVGEATDTPDSLRRYRGRLDAVLDFPLAGALELTFGIGAWSVRDLDGFLAAHERYMAEGSARVSFLDNHDMTRFLFLANNDRRRLTLAALCQFTLDAVPTVYYGTEVGLTQERDFAESGDVEARRDMPWDERLWDHDLLAFYRALIALRHAYPVLRHGVRRTVHLDPVNGTYAYQREGEGAAPLLVAFNVSGEERRISLPSEQDTPTVLLATVDASLRLDGRVLTLTPLSGALLGSTPAERA